MITLPSTFDNEELSKMELTATREIILKLKDVKNECELTIPRIKDMLERNGDYLSISTLRRVFAEGSEDDPSFSYDRTISPIARALLFQDHDEDCNADDDSSVVEDRIEGLKSVILLKNEQISNLLDQNEELKHQIDQMRSEFESRLNFLRDQISLKDRRMDEKDQMINRLIEKYL